MKKLRVKHYILIIIVLIPFIIFCSSYIKFRTNNIYESCTSELEDFLGDAANEENKVKIKDYLDFDSDGFYIIAPYTTTEYKHKIVGHEWYHYSTYGSYLINELLFNGDDLLENQQQLVFVKDNKVVSVAILDRQAGDFLRLEESYYDTNILFTSEADNGNYRIIVESY